MNFRVDTILFSRDRAMQLDAALRSFFLHCGDINFSPIHIIFTTTSQQHREQYISLQKEFQDKNIRWIDEKDFFHDLLGLLWKIYYEDLPFSQKIKWSFLRSLPVPARFEYPILLPFNNRFILFLVDDNLFVRDFLLSRLISCINQDPTTLGFSLRLGKNTEYCFPVHSKQNLPQFIKEKDALLFNWCNAELDFAYPLEISSSIYRLNDILSAINKSKFHNPNQFEGILAAHTKIFSKTKPFLFCAESSLTFCNPINRVQNVSLNRTGEWNEYKSDQLANLYDKGFRINVEFYNQFIPESCHQLVELNFY